MLAMQQLRQAVLEAYSAAAQRPRDKHAFPVGRSFAESIGYGPDVLDTMPPVAYEAFTGVSCVSVFADVPAGATVLDLGCGAGLDTLIAARCVGDAGHVIGVDFSDAMLVRARDAVSEAGATNVEIRQAAAESLPFEDAMFDVALVNGLFNLNPAREAIFSELARVVRPGGSVWAAELVLTDCAEEKPKQEPCLNVKDWFA